EMQLVVSGGGGPVRRDQVRAVGDTLRPKLDAERADMQPDPELGRQRPQPLQRAALPPPLNRRKQKLRLELHDRGVLGRLNIDRAALRRLADQSLCRREIGLNIATRSELHQARTKTLRLRPGHGSTLPGSVASNTSSLPSRSSST